MYDHLTTSQLRILVILRGAQVIILLMMLALVAL